MSSKRVIGSVEILGNLAINGKYALRTFNGTPAGADTGIITSPFYKRKEIQQILDMLPVSRIGEMDYLPLNISGSFSGATSYAIVKRVQPTIIEDDGTFVCIRSGTNGSTYNFYYAYIRNIRNIDALQPANLVQTNTVYKPSFFTSTQTIDQFYGTNGYELLWYKTIDGSTQNYVISLTNGTFNAVSHQSVSLPVVAFANYTPCYAHVVKDTIYMWGYDSSIGSGRALKLYTIPVSSVRSGVNTGFASVIGFNGQTIRGTAYTNSPTARIYDTYASPADGIDTLFVYGGEMNMPEYQEYCTTNALAYADPTGTKIRFAMFPGYRYTSTYNYSTTKTYAISMVYDISTKTFTYDTASRAAITVNGVLNGNQVVYNENNPYSALSVNWRGISDVVGNCGTICQASDGFMVSTRSRWASTSAFGISKSQINSFTTQFDSIKMGSRTVSKNSQLNTVPTYGSAVGENLMGPRFISPTRIILACSGTYDGVTNPLYDNNVVADVGTSTDFTYQSLTNGTITGYAPQPYRKFIDNTNLMYSGLVTLVDNKGIVTTHSSGLFEDIKLTGKTKLNPDTLEFDGIELITTNDVLLTIKAAIADAAGVTLTSKSKVGVYFMTNGISYSRDIGTLMIRNDDNTGTIVIAELTLNSKSNADGNLEIVGATVISTTVNTVSNISDVSSNDMKRFPGIYAAQYSGFNYLSVTTAGYFSVPGDTRTYTLIAKVKNGLIDSSSLFESYYLDTYGIVGGVLPNVGFGYYDNSKSNDYQTKSVFQLFGTTEAQMDAMIARTGTPLREVVVISQDVPEGFDVYFTQELPVFLGGYYDKLPPQTVNLTTIKANPANSTFYIYVNMNRNTGEASYFISTTMLDESLTRTYIGTIITGTDRITSIVTEKVTRFLTYRPSTTKRGSAIPASTGVPSGTGTRWK